MTYGPCTNPEPWMFGCTTTGSTCTVKARTWVEGRRLAMIELGCNQDEIRTIVNPTGGRTDVK